MAKDGKKTSEDDAPAEEDAPSGTSKKKKLLVVVAALVLFGGGYVFLAGGGGAEAAAEEEAAPVEGEVVALEPITLNLADGRFLKVGLALQLVEGVTPPAEAEIAGYAAPALDEAISLLGSMSYAELVAPGGRDSAKGALSERVAARYEDEVMSVYFTELVMQ